MADLDILSIDFDGLLRITPSTSCPGFHSQPQDRDYTSIDDWEELLDSPETIGIFRANGKWAARLAAVSILRNVSKAMQLESLEEDHSAWGVTRTTSVTMV